jgi:hypothetical protein
MSASTAYRSVVQETPYSAEQATHVRHNWVSKNEGNLSESESFKYSESFGDIKHKYLTYFPGYNVIFLTNNLETEFLNSP